MIQGITPYCNGRDPEEFGWVFTETGNSVDAYTLAYQTPDRVTAQGHGIPDTVLDEYEKSKHRILPHDTEQYGSRLCDWLQDKA